MLVSMSYRAESDPNDDCRQDAIVELSRHGLQGEEGALERNNN